MHDAHLRFFPSAARISCLTRRRTNLVIGGIVQLSTTKTSKAKSLFPASFLSISASEVFALQGSLVH